MNIRYSKQALDSIEEAPPAIRRAFLKQIRFLADNLHHPSLRAKKYDASRDLWQARVTRDWRFYFRIKGDTYWIDDVMPHPK
ncbi:MAG TPA: type II toxin-antitoxin system RelE/ParE family toxin [Bryobacteraceae bacterium]|nr:type II toxin-antitoxin system RelE/ParE family toxin [Bryobacteraceae bacterium]